MKLSTQLARGTLALPMLLGFGLLAMTGAEPVTAQAAERVAIDTYAQANQALEAGALEAGALEADALEVDAAVQDALAALPGPQAAADMVVDVARLCEARTGPRVLLLSQAPGDLGRLAVRFSHPCRA